MSSHKSGAAQQNPSNTLLDKSTDQLTKNLWTNSSDVNRHSEASHGVHHKGNHVLTKAKPITCFECNSHYEPECASHPQRFAKNCTNYSEGSAYVGCRKLDQWVDYDGGGELKAHHRVIRQCAANGDISKPCYYRAGYGGRMNACFCDTDLCNSGLILKSLNIKSLFFIICLMSYFY